MNLNNSKKWYASKTLWFNVAAFVVAVLASFGYSGTLPDDWAPFIVPIVTIINIILRLTTNKKLAA